MPQILYTCLKKNHLSIKLKFEVYKVCGLFVVTPCSNDTVIGLLLAFRIRDFRDVFNGKIKTCLLSNFPLKYKYS